MHPEPKPSPDGASSDSERAGVRGATTNSGSRRGRVLVAGLLLAVTVAAGAAAIGGLTGESGRATPSAVSSASPANPPVTRQAAIDRVLSARTQVRRADRVEAKLVTSQALREAGLTAPASGERVWAVAVAGELLPEFDTIGTRHSWGIFLLAADTGEIVGRSGGRVGPWPPAFDSLRDLDR